MKSENLELTSAELADVLGVSHRHASTLLKEGAIAGRQLTSSAWMTSPIAVERYLNTARQGRGRTLEPESAWGILWMLAGRETPWLPRSTAYRLRQDLGLMTATEIVRAVSARTKTCHFEGWPGSNALTGLILTGAPVASRIPGLRSRRRMICGYADASWIEDRPPRIGLTPRYDGVHVVLEKNFPFDYRDVRMPDVVIAADLAAWSTGDSHRREAALRAVTNSHRDFVASL